MNAVLQILTILTYVMSYLVTHLRIYWRHYDNERLLELLQARLQI